MDFDLSTEQQDVANLCREFAEGEIAPHAREWDAKAEFPLATRAQDGRTRTFGLALS